MHWLGGLTYAVLSLNSLFLIRRVGEGLQYVSWKIQVT